MLEDLNNTLSRVSNLIEQFEGEASDHKITSGNYNGEYVLTPNLLNSVKKSVKPGLGQWKNNNS